MQALACHSVSPRGPSRIMDWVAIAETSAGNKFWAKTSMLAAIPAQSAKGSQKRTWERVPKNIWIVWPWFGSKIASSNMILSCFAAISFNWVYYSISSNKNDLRILMIELIEPPILTGRSTGSRRCVKQPRRNLGQTSPGPKPRTCTSRWIAKMCQLSMPTKRARRTPPELPK